MTTTLTKTGPPGEVLDPRAGRSVLREAVQGRTLVRLRPEEGTPPREVPARLIGMTRSALQLALPPGNRVFASLAPAIPVVGTFATGGRAYRFTAHQVAPGDQEPTQGELLLQRPDTILVVERRRSPRHRRPGARVVIEVRSATPPPAVSGVLLNLSLDGLCCRLALARGYPLQADQELRVRFAPAERTPMFDLPAVARSVTPAATPAEWNVGVEFIPGPDLEAAQPRLAGVLTQPTERGSDHDA